MYDRCLVDWMVYFGGSVGGVVVSLWLGLVGGLICGVGLLYVICWFRAFGWLCW